MIGRIIGTTGRLLPEPLKSAMTAVAIFMSRLTRPSRTFTFRGKEYPYFYHPYNLAWRNERTVEIPIVWDILGSYRGADVLEVGNVMSHYFPVEHEVLDKYESGGRVINQDVVDFKPDRSYDLVLSISTLEHVGWDEEPREPEKILRALSVLSGFLGTGGQLVATFPLGYNLELDKMLGRGDPQFTEVYALEKVSWRNAWREVDLDSVLGTEYNSGSVKASAVVIGFIKHKTDDEALSGEKE